MKFQSEDADRLDTQVFLDRYRNRQGQCQRRFGCLAVQCICIPRVQVLLRRTSKRLEGEKQSDRCGIPALQIVLVMKEELRCDMEQRADILNTWGMMISSGDRAQVIHVPQTDKRRRVAPLVPDRVAQEAMSVPRRDELVVGYSLHDCLTGPLPARCPLTLHSGK